MTDGIHQAEQQGAAAPGRGLGGPRAGPPGAARRDRPVAQRQDGLHHGAGEPARACLRRRPPAAVGGGALGKAARGAPGRAAERAHSLVRLRARARAAVRRAAGLAGAHARGGRDPARDPLPPHRGAAAAAVGYRHAVPRHRRLPRRVAAGPAAARTRLPAVERAGARLAARSRGARAGRAMAVAIIARGASPSTSASRRSWRGHTPRSCTPARNASGSA